MNVASRTFVGIDPDVGIDPEFDFSDEKLQDTIGVLPPTVSSLKCDTRPSSQ